MLLRVGIAEVVISEAIHRRFSDVTLVANP